MGMTYDVMAGVDADGVAIMASGSRQPVPVRWHRLSLVKVMR